MITHTQQSKRCLTNCQFTFMLSIHRLQEICSFTFELSGYVMRNNWHSMFELENFNSSFILIKESNRILKQFQNGISAFDQNCFKTMCTIKGNESQPHTHTHTHYYSHIFELNCTAEWLMFKAFCTVCLSYKPWLNRMLCI